MIHFKTKPVVAGAQAQPRAHAPVKSEGQKRTEKNLQKKQKAVQALQEQLRSDLSERYRQFGEALKTAQAPIENEFYKADFSWPDNMRLAFQKAKDLERKQQGTRDRLAILQGEIQDLQRQLEVGQFPEIKPVNSKATQAMRKAEASGRRLLLSQGLEAALG